MPLRPRRRPGLPADLAQALELEPGERVLAWSPLAGNGVVAATLLGLRAVTGLGGRLVRRPWTDVDHVAWDEDSGTLAVWWVGERRPLPLEVGEESFVPEVVHERVRSSLVLARDVPINGRTAWVALRKAPDGTLSTQVVTPPGLRVVDPGVAVAIARAQAELRAEAGLPPSGEAAGTVQVFEPDADGSP